MAHSSGLGGRRFGSPSQTAAVGSANPLPTTPGASAVAANPASALVASSQPPTPLAPRLTTTPTAAPSSQVHQASGSSPASNMTSVPHQQQQQQHHQFHQRPRQLFSRATQALNMEPSPTTGRFAAYVRHNSHSEDGPQSQRLRNARAGSERHTEQQQHQHMQLPRSSSLRADHSLQHQHQSRSNLATSASQPTFARPPRRDEDSAAMSNIEVHPDFRRHADLPGDVLVRCGGVEFFVHKAILFYASPFFRAVLEGDWMESHPSLHQLSSADEDEESSIDGREEDSSDVDVKEVEQNGARPDSSQSSLAHETQLGSKPEVNDSQTANTSADGSGRSSAMDQQQQQQQRGQQFGTGLSSPRASFHTAFLQLGEDSEEGNSSSNIISSSSGSSRPRSISEPGLGGLVEQAQVDTLTDRLQRLATPPPPPSEPEDVTISSPSDELRQLNLQQNTKKERKGAEGKRKKRRKKKSDKDDGIIAVIDLREEDAATFQDVLCHIYPHLELRTTWYNIFSLFSFSDKFAVPYLRQACCTFLRAALAGRPIDAMALGERHGLDDVYREASRHVLDNMPQWEPEELEVLSKETLLKLERKRTWFLERLLKLGLANPGRDYECHAACPDPVACARRLQDRWQAQYAQAFRFGPPQPSVIWRHLREMDVSPAINSAAMSGSFLPGVGASAVSLSNALSGVAATTTTAPPLGLNPAGAVGGGGALNIGGGGSASIVGGLAGLGGGATGASTAPISASLGQAASGSNYILGGGGGSNGNVAIGDSASSSTSALCQSTARTWVQGLFDRMYGLPTHAKTPSKFLAVKLGPENGTSTTNRAMPNARQAGQYHYHQQHQSYSPYPRNGPRNSHHADS